jgi:hypothetical protein
VCANISDKADLEIAATKFVKAICKGKNEVWLTIKINPTTGEIVYVKTGGIQNY